MESLRRIAKRVIWWMLVRLTRNLYKLRNWCKTEVACDVVPTIGFCRDCELFMCCPKAQYYIKKGFAK